MQEVIHETKPDCVIYTGVAAGGSLVMISDLLRLANPGNRTLAIGIDIESPSALMEERNLRLIRGDSASSDVVSQVLETADQFNRIMVILDLDHTKKHVLMELEIYAPLVTVGCYLIVEDTCIAQTCCFDFGPGPHEALGEWLPSHPEFVVDHYRERWGLTQHPGGYLRKTR